MQASQNIDQYIQSLPAWQQDNLALFRNIVHEAVPDIEEDWKCGVPVFSLGGKSLFVMAAFKDHTKFNFIRNGALLDDTDQLFNNGLESKKSRGIDLQEGRSVNRANLMQLTQKAYRLAAS